MPKGIKGFQKGIKFSEEHKRRISLSMMGKKNSLGFIYSKEYRDNMSRVKKGHSVSEETKRKIRLANKGKHGGELSGNWIKDRTKLKISDRKLNDVQYIYWAREIKKRDNWKCKMLNQDCKGRLESHHILDWVNYPELRYEINNGITLCHAHHPRGRKREAELSPYLQSLVAENK